MSKKFYIALLLIFLIAVFVVVLYGGTDNLKVREIDDYIETTTKVLDKIDNEGYVNGIHYSITDVNYYENYKERGYYSKVDDNKVTYTITSGEKSTGGYSIKITSLEIDEEKNVIICVNEKSPSVDSINTMALTYPTISIEIDANVNSIKIVDSNNKEFSKLD